METNYYQEFLNKKTQEENQNTTEISQPESSTGLYEQFLVKREQDDTSVRDWLKSFYTGQQDVNKIEITPAIRKQYESRTATREQAVAPKLNLLEQIVTTPITLAGGIVRGVGNEVGLGGKILNRMAQIPGMGVPPEMARPEFKEGAKRLGEKIRETGTNIGKDVGPENQDVKDVVTGIGEAIPGLAKYVATSGLGPINFAMWGGIEGLLDAAERGDNEAIAFIKGAAKGALQDVIFRGAHKLAPKSLLGRMAATGTGFLGGDIIAKSVEAGKPTLPTFKEGAKTFITGAGVAGLTSGKKQNIKEQAQAKATEVPTESKLIPPTEFIPAKQVQPITPKEPLQTGEVVEANKPKESYTMQGDKKEHKVNINEVDNAVPNIDVISGQVRDPLLKEPIVTEIKKSNDVKITEQTANGYTVVKLIDGKGTDFMVAEVKREHAKGNAVTSDSVGTSDMAYNMWKRLRERHPEFDIRVVGKNENGGDRIAAFRVGDKRAKEFEPWGGKKPELPNMGTLTEAEFNAKFEKALTEPQKLETAARPATGEVKPGIEPPEGMKERQTVTNTLNKVWDGQVDGVVGKEKFYTEDSNKRQLEDAGNRIKMEGADKRLEHLMNREMFTADDNVESLTLINSLKASGDYARAQQLTIKHAQMGTATAQAQQSQNVADILNHPETVAQKIINEAKKKLPPKLAKKLGDVTPEQIKKWTEMADQTSQLPDGAEKDIGTAEIFKDIRSNIPATFWRKVSTVQAIHQLLNLKTAARNVLGNTGMNALEMISHYIGTPIDMLFSTLTKNRTVTTPRLMKYMRDGITGFKLSLKDINRSVDTSKESLERRTGMKLEGEFENMFNFAAGSTFKKGSVYGQLEKAVGYIMQAPDRAFFEAGFWASLDNQMRASGKAKFEKPMVQQAVKEAARLTFRDANNISNALVKVKGALNELIGNKDFGLGEFVLKYPKVPGAIVKRGIEYSPFGVLGSALKIKEMLSNKGDTVAQREAALSSARTILGAAIATTGYALAKAGYVTGKQPDNDKLAALDAAMGKRPYSVKAFGKWWSYDWFQPTAMAFTMGVDFEQKKELDKKGENILSQIGNSVSGMMESAGATVTEQPVFTGVSRLFGKGVTGTERGVVSGMRSMAESAPSTFIPSLMAQIASTIDPNKRTIPTDFVGRILGLVENRTPWVSRLLNKRKDVLGNEAMRGTGNKIVDTILNIVSPTIMSEIKSTPETEFLLQLFNETKETEVLPRTYGKTITYRNKTYELNQSQQSDLQTKAAQMALNRIGDLLHAGVFKTMTKESQVKYIERIFNYAGEKTRYEMIKTIKPNQLKLKK